MRFGKTNSEVQDGVRAWRMSFGVPPFTCALGSSLIKFNCVLRDLSLETVYIYLRKCLQIFTVKPAAFRVLTESI